MLTSVVKLDRPLLMRSGAWTAVAVVPLVAFWVRLVAHPRHVRDSETISLLPTMGRELAHDQLAYFGGMHINPLHPSYIVDGVLCALGFEVFGDRYLAWQWVPLLYLVAFALAGTVALRRTVGWRGAALFPLLLAAAPFLLKDGMLAAVGAHGTGAVWSLVALALALGIRARKGFDWRAFGVGLVYGVGLFYLRTALAAAPAVALATARGGWRSARDAALGMLVLPVLVAVNVGLRVQAVVAEKDGGTMLASDIPQAFAWVFQLGTDAGGEEVAHGGLAKLGDVVALPVMRLLFAQPPAMDDGLAPVHVWSTAFGGLWVGAWCLGLAGVVALVVFLARENGGLTRRPSYPALLLALLPLGYAAIYVVAPVRMDESVFWNQSTLTAPGVTEVRLIIPILMLLTLLLAQGLGWLLREGRWRPRAALAVAAILVVGGGMAAGVDGCADRAPGGTLRQMAPYTYEGFHRSDRGLARWQHAQSPTRDAVSRGNHLRAVGLFDCAPTARTVAKPSAALAALDGSQQELGLTALERSYVAHGMGEGLGDALLHGEGWDIPTLAAAGLLSAEVMSPADGRAYLRGFGEAVLGDCSALDRPGAAVDAFCGNVHSERPLCFAAGACHAPAWYGEELPWTAVQLFPGHEAWAQSQDADVLVELIRGVGWRTGGVRPPLQLEALDAPPWPDEQWQAFQDGWRAGARHVWLWPDAVYPEDPWHQP